MRCGRINPDALPGPVMTFPAGLLGPEFLFLIAVVIVAGLIRGFTGFGSALVIVPLFSTLLAPAQTIAVMLLIEVLVTIQLMPRALRSTNWRLVGQLTVPALVTIPLGAYALVTFDAGVIRMAVSIVVLLWASLLLIGVRYEGRLMAPATMGIGALSGGLMGAVGLGGPPVVVYLLTTPARAESHRANIIVFFGLTVLYFVAVLVLNRVYTETTIWTAVILTPFFLAAAWLGTRLFDRSGEALFRRVALVFLIFVGLVTLLV